MVPCPLIGGADPSYPTVKLDQTILAPSIVKLGLQRFCTDGLALREGSERKWQCEDGGSEDEA